MKTLNSLLAALTAVITAAGCTTEQEEKQGYPISPVPFTSVRVPDNSFWGRRLQASREVTIPLAFSKCEETGRYTNFQKAALQLNSKEYLNQEVTGFSFDDTDVYKTIEGASYVLQTMPDKKLENYIDSVLTIIASAQESDGYLYTARTINPQKPHHWAGETRWSQVEKLSHELYNLGHMTEAAVAHWQATGKRTFLDIAIKYADCVVREVGPDEGQACVVPGHQIAEMALAKLYLATGDKKYLNQAKFFLDYRGKTTIQDTYSQSHKPIKEQDEAVGHAVRAGYMYAGIADVAALTGDKEYIDAIDRIWENIVTRKLYITGGIGATSEGEAFGENYFLPNETSYCETCAAIANVYFNYRMFLLHGESKYFDVLERTLYNGLISGVSLDGGEFFYPNPLASSGQHKRQPWFGCACCPSNLCRFVPSLPGYIYAAKGDSLWVNLYTDNTLTTKVGDKNVTISQKTQYPWDGNITISIDDLSKDGPMALKLRIPGWARGEVTPGDLYFYADTAQNSYSVRVNGTPVSCELQDGYFVIDRKWAAGDKVVLQLEMNARFVRAESNVEADRGLLAIEKGPIVYCAEWPDNDFDVKDARISTASTIQYNHREDKLGGIDQLSLPARLKGGKNVILNLIPYYSWCNRGSGVMTVWLKEDI